MTLYNKNDPHTVAALFDSIAANYDKTNGVLSWQMHKKWNKHLIQQVLQTHQPEAFLDLCCGTGAITFEYLVHTTTRPKVYMLDFSKEMLHYGKKLDQSKGLNHDITYLQADAQAIPLAKACVNCVTIAYGIRNIKNPELCIQEAFRVLKPGGTFGILELTKPSNPLLRFGHSLYLRTCLPIMGKFLTSNKEAYNYLCNSIHSFIPPDTLERLMQQAGFSSVCKKSLSGGIATLLIGKKK